MPPGVFSSNFGVFSESLTRRGGKYVLRVSCLNMLSPPPPLSPGVVVDRMFGFEVLFDFVGDHATRV